MMMCHCYPILCHPKKKQEYFVHTALEAVHSNMLSLRDSACLLRIPCAEFSEGLNKLLHFRESNRSKSALAYAATASYNAVIGGCNNYPHFPVRVHAMRAEVTTDPAIRAELLVNCGIPWDQFSGYAHLFAFYVSFGCRISR